MRRISAGLAVLLTIAYLAYLVAIPLGLMAHRLEVHELVLAAGLLVGICFTASSYSITDLSIGAGGTYEEFDLKRYVAITEAGREYVRLRERL